MLPKALLKTHALQTRRDCRTSLNFAKRQGYDENTLLADMPARYLSVFFRKKFTVTDPQAVKWLTLRIDYDDGFLAYLNGTEVARRGFAPGAAVSFDTPAALLGTTWGEEIRQLLAPSNPFIR